MRTNYCRFILLLLITTILCAVLSVPVFAQRYILTDLVSPIGGDLCRADDVNNVGQIVGWTTNALGECFPFIWNKEDGFYLIGPLPVTHTYTPGPMSINILEQVAGNAHFFSQTPPHAFLWTEEGGINDLGAPSGPNYQSTSRAYDINDFGQIVGESDQTFGHRPLLWTSTGELNELQTLGFAGGAHAINNLGYIVGWSASQSGPQCAALWTDVGEVRDLGLGDYSAAFGINNLGDVVGYYSPLPSEQLPNPHVFLLKVDEMIDLGTLGERRWSEADDINDLGQIVGSSWTLVPVIDEEGQGLTDGDYHAFLWDQANGMQDLNDLIPPGSGLLLTHATAINNAGQIVGWGQMDLDSDGNFDEVHGFLLTPAPSQWIKTYGGNNWDQAFSTNSVQQSSDGGYIVAGNTGSFGTGSSDFWILKLDTNGNVLWQNTYGGGGNDYANSIQQTSDGGYIVAGETASFGAGNYDFLVLRLDASGNVLWQNTYGGGGNDYAYSIQQTSDGGYIVAGDTESFGAGDGDSWVLKLDANGNVLWQKTYGGSLYDRAESIQQTTDGGYIVFGENYSFGTGNGDFWVFKLDASGNVLWQKTYGGSFLFNVARSIQQTLDNGYIVAGMTQSFGAGSGDAWVLKLDTNGNVQWQKTYGGSDFDGAAIQQTSDGGYIMVGRTASFGAGSNDVWVLKLNTNGNVQWQKTYGGSDSEITPTIRQTSDGGYIAAGVTYSFGAGDQDVLVLKLNSNGDIPGCSIAGTSNAIVTNTSATITNTSVTGINTTVSPQTSAVTVVNTNATVTEVCYSSGSEVLTLLSPNGGEIIPSGSIYTISWSAPPEAARFDIGYSLDNGAVGTWKLIASNITDYSYNWTVPAPDGNKYTCRVGVRGYNSSGGVVGTDTSDNPFTIEVVKLTYPDGGETLTSGETYRITWQTNGTIRPVQSVQIYGSPNEGQLGTWRLLTTVSGNPGYYDWTVPQVGTAKDKCRLGVRLLDSASIPIGHDIGDGNFTIQPAP